MKKSAILAAVLLTLFASPAMAVSGKGPDKDSLPEHAYRGIEKATEHSPIFKVEEIVNTELEVELVENENEVEVEQEIECNAEREWVNHGAYVSCVAHVQQGMAVSAAARSDIGKRSQQIFDSDIAPTTTPDPEPSISPDPEATSSPTPTAEDDEVNEIRPLVDEIRSLINTLKSLINDLLPQA